MGLEGYELGQDLEWDEAVINLIQTTSDGQISDRVFLFCTVIEAFLWMA